MPDVIGGHLQDDHLSDDHEPTPLVDLDAAGYPVTIEAIHPVVSVKDGDADRGYLVHEVTTYGVPPAEADATADEITLFVCHCGDYVFRRSPELEPGTTPADWERCKHGEAVQSKHDRAAADQSQVTLG